MKEIEVTIGGRSYRLAVDDGQENRVSNVAAQFDRVVESLRKANGGNIERDRLLVLAGVMLADEMLNQKQRHQTERQAMLSFHNGMAERLERVLSSANPAAATA